jgi:hypothetical protein
LRRNFSRPPTRIQPCWPDYGPSRNYPRRSPVHRSPVPSLRPAPLMTDRPFLLVPGVSFRVVKSQNMPDGMSLAPVSSPRLSSPRLSSPRHLCEIHLHRSSAGLRPAVLWAGSLRSPVLGPRMRSTFRADPMLRGSRRRCLQDVPALF